MKIKKIFKREIALELIQKGHQLVYTEPNLYKRGFVVFLFIETTELLEELTVLTKHN